MRREAGGSLEGAETVTGAAKDSILGDLRDSETQRSGTDEGACVPPAAGYVSRCQERTQTRSGEALSLRGSELSQN